MSKEIVAGRSALKRSFREFFVRAIDDGKDTRSFLPFKKKLEPPVSPPWIYLYHGEECLGKTTALDYCISIANEAAEELKQTVNIVSLDWDDWNFEKGDLPADRIEVIEAIAEVFHDAKGELAGSVTTLRKTIESYRKNSSYVEELLRRTRLDEALRKIAAETTAPDEPEDLSSPLHNTQLTPQEIDLYENGEKKLTELLIKAILSVSDETPLLLSIDSYDRLTPELEEWFRREVLVNLAEKRSRLFLFIAGNTSVLRSFRNDFSEDTLFPVNLTDIPLTRHTIGLLCSKQRISVSPDEISKIERVTAGIPFLVHDVLFYAAQGIPIDSLLDDTTGDARDAATLCGSILNRFFTQCSDETVRERIFSLAMFSQYNPKALAETWNVPFADVKRTLADLSKQVSFLKEKIMHHHLRRLLRVSLIQEAASGSESSLKPFFAGFSTSSVRVFKELLVQLQTAVPAAEKRCHDPRYLSAIEQLVCGLMWSSPTDAFSALPGFYIELLHFNTSFARKLLGKVAEFRQLFSPLNQNVFKLLINGISTADKSNLFNRIDVGKTEDELIEYLEGVSGSMNDFHRALCLHLNATTEFRKDNLKSAMDLLDRSFSLLGNSSPEKSILYEDYVLLGCSFNRAGEHRNAIEAFSNAVLIHPDGFVSWYSMGTSRIALSEYEGAINALSESVKIDPQHADAWFCLGLSDIQVRQFPEALAALQKAVELSPERPEIWFELAGVYRELAQHQEAVKALRKVVLARSDYGEAWVLLGHSSSLLGIADEAIEAYQKAIELKPKSVEPLKALGIEFFRLSRFDEAIDALSKATKISKKDFELWTLIAEAQIGATRYDKAVSAGEKALAIEPADSRAWTAVGNAQMLQNNFDEAIDAFTKAIETIPDNADIWLKLGTIYNNKNDHDAAIAAFKKAVAYNPELKEVWYTIGQAYENQKKYADAVTAYEKGTQADPANSDCWFHKGNMHRTLEQFDEAFECYSRVVDLTPDFVDGWFNRGSTALITGNFKDAVASFAKVAELDNENAEGWFQLGRSYQETGESQNAIRSFTEAANHDGMRTDIWHQLGISCETLGIYEEAIQAFERCAELDASNPVYPTELGSCYTALQQYAEAHDAFTRAVELDPHNNDTLFKLALTCHAQENYAEAIKHYNDLITADTEHADARFNLALAYHAAGDYTGAVETYLAYVNKWPDNGTAWFNLGLAYHAAQSIDDAVATYKEAVKIVPDNPDIWYHLGIALHSKELFGDAIQAYRKVVQLVPEHTDAWFNLGLAYFIWQNYVDAIESYINAVKHDPQHHTAWGNLAIAYFAVNDFTKGTDAARHAYEINPDEPWIVGNMIIGTLFSGDSLQAQEFADRLSSLDTSGASAATVKDQIRLAAAKQPQTAGVEAVIARLDGVPLPPDTDELTGEQASDVEEVEVTLNETASE